MAKSFIDVVQDSPRTGLGIPVKTKKPPLPLASKIAKLVQVIVEKSRKKIENLTLLIQLHRGREKIS